MENILLLVHQDTGQEARLQAALDVTRAVKGHLTCADVSVMPILADDYVGSMGTAMLLEDERTREAENRVAIEARLAGEQVAWDWADLTGEMAQILSDMAGLADLIVVNRKLDRGILPDMLAVASEVVLKSGRPILAVPEDGRGCNFSGNVLVCWDGSAAATSAMRAAVPLLKLATNVTLLEVVDGSIKAPAEEAAAYLSRHGVHPVIERRTVLQGQAAEAIGAEIRRRHIDYVVMGGFGHFRFIETLLGGVTRAMLSGCPVPLFLAH